MRSRLPRAFAILSLAASCFQGSSAWAGPAAPAPESPTPATQPADTTQPHDTLAQQREKAQARLAKLKTKYGQKLRYELDDKLKVIFATALDDQALAETRQMMTAHERAISHDLFSHGPEQYISVVIPGGWNSKKVTGHFYPPDYLDARSIGSDLKHEFTHALHFADQQARGQEHPVWVMEGLASLYQYSDIVDGHLVPRVDGALSFLQSQIHRKAQSTWQRITHLEHRQFTSQQYPQSRYMFLYLYQTGKLRAWYDAYTADYDHDPSGLSAFAKVFAKPVEQVEKEWTDWVLHLAPALGATPATLEIGMGQTLDGLKIEQLPPAPSAAVPAELAINDVILTVGGKRTVDFDDLERALQSHAPGDHVKVQYRHDKEHRETTVTLVALPERAKAH